MPKTYNTISTFTAGQVLTAAEMNEIGENVNNYRVPPMCSVYRSSDLTGYTSSSLIAWNNEEVDTDAMWSSGTDITINTAGVYVITFTGNITAASGMTNYAPNMTLNGTECASAFHVAPVGTNVFWTISSTVKLVPTDTIAARVFLATGASFIVKGAATQTSSQTRLSVLWVGQAS